MSVQAFKGLLTSNLALPIFPVPHAHVVVVVTPHRDDARAFAMSKAAGGYPPLVHALVDLQYVVAVGQRLESK